VFVAPLPLHPDGAFPDEHGFPALQASETPT